MPHQGKQTKIPDGPSHYARERERKYNTHTTTCM